MQTISTLSKLKGSIKDKVNTVICCIVMDVVYWMQILIK